MSTENLYLKGENTCSNFWQHGKWRRKLDHCDSNYCQLSSQWFYSYCISFTYKNYLSCGFGMNYLRIYSPYQTNFQSHSVTSNSGWELFSFGKISLSPVLEKNSNEALPQLAHHTEEWQGKRQGPSYWSVTGYDTCLWLNVTELTMENPQEEFSSSLCFCLNFTW